MIQMNHNQKIKFLILVVLLKKLITILKPLKQRIKFLILATKRALTTVENKIRSVSNLVKKTDYNTEVTEIENILNNHNHDKYIDTSEFNKLVVNIFNVRITQANLVVKTDFDARLSSLNRKITQNKSKHLLVENQLNTPKNKIPDVSSLVKKTDYNTKIGEIDTKVSNLDGKIDKNILDIIKVIASLTAGNILFDGGDGKQAYLVFQPVCKYFKLITGTNYIS